MSDTFRIGVYRPLKDDVSRTSNFTRAAGDYSRLGLECFNQCISPQEEVSSDGLRGMEKRCMDGCLTVHLQNFTAYGTQYSQ